MNQFVLQRENFHANRIAEVRDLLTNRINVAYDSKAGYPRSRFLKRHSRGGCNMASADFVCRNNSSCCSDCRVLCMRDVQLESSMLLEATVAFRQNSIPLDFVPINIRSNISAILLRLQTRNSSITRILNSLIENQ